MKKLSKVREGSQEGKRELWAGKSRSVMGQACPMPRDPVIVSCCGLRKAEAASPWMQFGHQDLNQSNRKLVARRCWALGPVDSPDPVRSVAVSTQLWLDVQEALLRHRHGVINDARAACCLHFEFV